MEAKELAEKLELYPELKARVEQLVHIVENKNGETTLADVAEQRIIDELRQLGHESLQGWADRQSRRASAQLESKMPKACKNVKKKFAGIALMET